MRASGLGIYVITNASGDRRHEEVASAAIRGGATAIQLRDKDMDDAEFIRTARKILKITRRSNVPLIINDRVEAAVACGAEGVHIGQSDMSYDLVKNIMPEGSCIGLSVTCEPEAKKACLLMPSYIGVGPVFPTESKKDAAKPLGLEALRRIVEQADVPVVAIGGITAGNVRDVLETGVAGVAVIKEVAGAADMVYATRRLADIWRDFGCYRQH